MRLVAILLVSLAAALPAQELTEVRTLTTADDHYDKYVSIAYDRAGTLCAAYTSMQGDNDRIVLNCGKGEERIDAGEGLEANPKLLVDRRGALWTFWHGRRQGTWNVFARRRGGHEMKIASNALHPVVTLDRSGRIWAAWESPKRGGFVVQVAHTERGGWSRPQRIESSGSDRRPSIAAAPDGTVWVAWDSTRTGNYDIFLARADHLSNVIQVTSHGTIDDTPSLAVQRDGTLWIAWNGMRGHAHDRYRTDRHGGDAFVRAYRNGQLLPALQASFGAVDKTPLDAVDPYFHWKQTQNYPIAFVDAADRLWVIWRTDATGAHNFDLWARVLDRGHWSKELHLTGFSPGRDEFPAAANAPDGHMQLAWEGQALPTPGETNKFLGGDVDLYNTLAIHNVILTARVTPPSAATESLRPAAEDVYRAEDVNEPVTPGPPPGTATTSDGRYHIYFGDPHSHSILSDAKTGWPDQLLELERDRLGLDFGVVSDHTEMGKLQATEFAEVQLTASVFTEPGRFVSLSGWEWTAGPAYGHRVIVFRGDPVRPLSSQVAEGNTIEKLYAHVRGHDAVMSPHHTGHATWGRWNPDAPFDETLEPNFEIASWHGRFEFYGNRDEGRKQVPGHQFQDALRRGHHVGVMGASDTHHLSPGEGGLTAVLADRLDRESIWDAIRNRRNYATTGARIVLEFNVAGAPMGSRVEHQGPLEMTVRVEGTAPIDRVEIVRNLIDTFAAIRLETNGGYMIYEPSDPQGGRRITIPDTRKLTFTVHDTARPAGETSYYVRVTQADGQQAWSSPVWVK